MKPEWKYKHLNNLLKKFESEKKNYNKEKMILKKFQKI